MKKKILIVEDEKSIRETLADFLASEGYAVFTAPNGDKGLELLWSLSPDLVILDLMLPIVDGFEFKRIMDSNPGRINIPVIVFTAQPERAPSGMNVAAVLNKSTSLDKILEMIKVHLP